MDHPLPAARPHAESREAAPGLGRRAVADLPRRLVLLAFAAALWFFVQGRITDRRDDVLVDFEVRPPGPDVTVVGRVPRKIRVSIRGPRSRIENLRPADIHAWIDARGQKEGEPFPLDPARLRTDLPAGFSVELSPKSPRLPANVLLDRWMEGSLPVSVELRNGNLLEKRGLRLGTPPYRILPTTRVPVRLPQGALARPDLALKALPIDLGRVTGAPYSEPLKFEELEGVQVVEKAWIELAVVASQTKAVENVPVRILVPPDYPFRCVVEDRDRVIPSVRVSGEPAAVEGLAAADVAAYVTAPPDPTKVRPDEPYADTVRFQLPPGVSLADPAPIRINVILKAIPDGGAAPK